MNNKDLRKKVFYQIFPRSFKDYNNDGNGDLKGIIEKLDYIKSLNIDAIWLCPVYETEFKDAGYDVLDYFKIWSQFGTIEDFKQLVAEAKKRNIDIMMDIVLNHTSTNHVWFQKAIENVDNPEHDYYIWANTPSKAESIFGGSAWEYVPSVKKYYLHLFAKEQADLNWGNKATVKAMAEVIDFWYQLGVRYFRLDAVQHVAKDFLGDQMQHSFATHMLQYLQNFVDMAFKDKPDAYLIGEATGINNQQIIDFSQGKNQIMSAFYNFNIWWVGWGKETGRNGYDPNWKITQLTNSNNLDIQNNPNIKGDYVTNFLSNHDTSRAISRWGDEKFFWKESAKSLALFQFSLKGSQVVYYGEEIGMTNPNFLNRNEFRDVDALNSYKIFVDEQKRYSEEEMTTFHNINGRDNTRYPMKWDDTINFGFNKGTKTWIKTGTSKNPDNVAKQEKDKTSILNFYRELINFKKNESYADFWNTDDTEFRVLENNVFQVIKKYQNKELIILINLTPYNKEIFKISYTKTHLRSYTDNKKITTYLRPYESVVFEK
ncbi:alpha-amylase family glycosyl hydrolase [Candidatus Mycoplasma pogonae]